MAHRSLSAFGRPFAWVFAVVMSLGILGPAPSARALDGAWSALDPLAPAPSPRREFAAVYDDLNRRYLIFGGLYMYPYQLFNEVWVLSLGATPSWSLLSVEGSPPGERHSPQYGYDPVRHRVLFFGGYGRHHPGDPYAYLNDVWELSLEGTPRWTELFPSGTPPSGRLAGAAAYDVLRQRFVGFGGTVGVPVDTWELDLSGAPAWSSIPSDGPAPDGGYGMTSIYDPVRDRMIIFGGSTSDNYYGVHNDTWELQLHGEVPNWHPLDPQGPLPVARRSMASIYDPLRDRMIIHGGWDSTENGTDSFLDDTWALSLHGSLQWTQLETGGALPPGRDAMAAAYDPTGDRMVIFGGFDGLVFLGDTQFLTWGDSGAFASASAVAQAEPDMARVEWSLSNATGSYVGVYRRQAGSPWSSIGTADADGSGAVAFEDPTVAPGQRYGYLITIASERGEQTSEETWVETPTLLGVGSQTGIGFAMNRIQPNPAIDRFTTWFTLPDAEPARLEVLDVGGRRVASREVGTLGPGAHTLQFDARGWGAGVYFVRLRQSGRVAQGRVILMPATAAP